MSSTAPMDEAINNKKKGITPFRWFSLSTRRSKSILPINEEVPPASPDERDFCIARLDDPNNNTLRTSVHHQFGVLPDGNRPKTASANDRSFKVSTHSIHRRILLPSRPPTTPPISQLLLAKDHTITLPCLATKVQDQREVTEENQMGGLIINVRGELEISREPEIRNTVAQIQTSNLPQSSTKT